MTVGIISKDKNFIPVMGAVSSASDTGATAKSLQYDPTTRGLTVHIVGNDVATGSTVQIVDAGGEAVTVTDGKLDVNASVDTTGLATSAIQTDGSQKSQIVDAGGEAVTVTGGKLDVNASIDTTGLATSTKQSDGSQKTQLVDGSGNVIGSTGNAIDVNLKSGGITAVTANAGTNLNTSALALETGGNLASIKTNTDKIPALGQALAAASVPVVLTAAQLTTLTPPAAITNFANETGGNLAAINAKLVTGTDIGDVTINNSTGAAAVNIQDGGNSITVDGTVTANPTTPSTLVAFVTAVTTAGSRVQLGNNAVQGVVVQAPSTNTGLIYVGGSNVSSTVFGAELQPGQSTGIAIDNTNKIYIDSSVNGDKLAVIGS